MTVTTNKKTDFALKSLILEAVSNVLSDPDYGLEIKSSFEKKLLSRKKDSSKSVSLAEIKKKYL